MRAALSIAALLLVAGLPGRAEALGPSSLIRVVQLRYPGGNWNPRPDATRVLAEEIAFRTSIDTDTQPTARTLDDPDLFDYPLLLLSGDQSFPSWSDEHVSRLRHHVEAGGFLLIDNAAESERAFQAFDAAVRRLVGRMFPSRELGAVPSDHVLYRSFYRLDYPSGRNLRKGYVEGVSLGRRIAVVYVPNDILGALERDSFGTWSRDLVPGSGRQREMAIRFGVNLAMYALCLHYKDDQVHVRYLLKRRNWRIRPPDNP